MSTPNQPDATPPGLTPGAPAPDTAEPAPVEETVYTPEPLVSPIEAQELEAGEPPVAGHYVTVALAGQPVRVMPPGRWRQSWMRMLKNGDADAFAEEVVHPDDFDLYDKIDATNDEVGAFFQDAAEVAGESLGKSSGPTASSRRMRRR